MLLKHCWNSSTHPPPQVPREAALTARFAYVVGMEFFYPNANGSSFEGNGWKLRPRPSPVRVALRNIRGGGGVGTQLAAQGTSG